MITAATPCPSQDDLRRLSVGQLESSQSDSLFEHIRQCAACRGELETIEDGEDSLIAALRQPLLADDFAHEPDCQGARIKALGALEAMNSLANQAAAADAVWEGDVTPPPRIGEYEIVRPLGRGGMGSVFLARHTKLGREVAVKLLASHRLADPRMKQRFEAEMRAVGRLSHPNVVTAHDAREVDGTAVLVTEYIDGLDLGQLLRRTGPLPVADACEIARQVAVALAYTSGQAFVHRDVKPSNVMLSRQGEVKLLDLGLARFLQAEGSTEMTAGGQAMGTADYVAPEQVTDSRSVDVRADIYSLGCTLFRLLTGSAPFADETHGTVFAKMTAHVSQPPPSLAKRIPGAGVAGSLVKLVDSMLAKDPSRRPQTAQEVADRLQTHAVGADLPRLAELAVGLAPAEEPAAAPARLLGKPQTAEKPRRMVPLWLAVAAGLGGMVLGMALGLMLTIKTPSGETISLSVPDGSSVEIASATRTPVSEEPAAVERYVPEVSAIELYRNESSLLRDIPTSEPQAGEQSTDEPIPQGMWIIRHPSVRVADGTPPVGMTLVAIADSDVFLVSVGNRENTPPGLLAEQAQKFFHALDFFSPPAGQAIRRGTVAMNGNNGLVFSMEDGLVPHELTAFVSRSPEREILFSSQPRKAANRPDPSQLYLSSVGPFPKSSEWLPYAINTPAILKNKDQFDQRMYRQAVLDLFNYLNPEYSLRDAREIQQQLFEDSKINLKRIGLGFHRFHDAHGLLPSSSMRVVGARPAYAHDRIHPFSWRVALLPFIGETALYDQYRFGDPWDSEHNQALLTRMPLMYRSPFTSLADEQANPGHTHYLGFVGDQTALGDVSPAQPSFRSITDGTAITLLVIESESSVPWTKPEDLPLHGPEDLEKLSLRADQPIPLLMADGAVRRMYPLDRELLGQLITRNGGEPVDLRVLFERAPDTAVPGSALR